VVLYDIYGTSGDLRFKISAICRSHLGSQAFRSLALQEVRLRSRVADLKNLIREAQIALLAAVEEPQTSEISEDRRDLPRLPLPLPYLSSLYVQIWKYVYTCVYSTSYMTHILYIPAIFQVVAGKQSVATSMGEPSSVSVLNNSSRRRYRKYARSWSDISDSPWVGGKDIKDLTEGPYEDLMISRM
jgi:hypothetical protein